MTIQSFISTFEHGADIGIRGIGLCLEEAFINGAKAMFSIMVEDIKDIRPVKEVRINTGSFDLTALFVAYLNALLAKADINGLIFSAFDATIDTKTFSIEGTARGEKPIDSMIGIEVKGATFCEAIVKRGENGLFIAQCVVDV